jgi:hypothetical protein
MNTHNTTRMTAGAHHRQRRTPTAMVGIAARCWSRMKPTSRRLVEATPDIALAELKAELQRRLGISAGLSTCTTRFAGSG